MIFGQSRYLPDELKPVSLSARRQSHYLPDEMQISLRQSHYLADTTVGVPLFANPGSRNKELVIQLHA
jgi:hypothetical protein